jgi:hypothetical protein
MLFVAFTALSNFDIVEPYIIPLHIVQGKVRDVSPYITVGPYPRGDQIRGLKKRGITVDICLLNLALPQERALYEQLKKYGAKEGIEVISFPLSYLNLESTENKEMVSRVVSYIQQNRGKKIYIHCYLGRHRVKVVEDELRRVGLMP